MNRILLGLIFSISIPILLGLAQDAYAGNAGNGPVGAVGVDFIEPDTTELLLAGMQTNLAWIIPVSLSAVGIGVFVARRMHA